MNNQASARIRNWSCARLLKVFILFGTVTIAVHTICGQQPKLKVYISADMEGIGGVVTWGVQGLPPGREYEKFRRLMTQEVNAAVTGAFEAGASEVLVSDSHGDAQNIDIELLDKRARLVRSWPRPLGMMQGIDSTFDAVVLVGYHAGEGTEDAVIAHTFSGRESIKLNGQPASEVDFNAAIAADFGVPVVFLSGDQVVTKLARDRLGPIETATVKQAIGYNSAITISPEESQNMIRVGVKLGIEKRKQIVPVKLSHPIKMEITYKDVLTAEIASYLKGVRRVSGNTISYEAQDMTDASKFRTVIAALRP
jgi:D-amino peptidase